MDNKILLSFDLEEFDIPEEYGQKLTEKEKLDVTMAGLIPLLELLEKHEIKATFYSTAFFAESRPEIVKKIAERYEIASHGFYHSSFKEDDISRSKSSLENITGKAVNGFRMARLMPVNELLLVNAGYRYNSSLNPTYIPGRYNNLSKARKPFQSSGLMILPTSVATILRIPLFWISFKNFPGGFYTMLTLSTLKKDKYLNLYFHPWEFADISKYKLPFYVKSVSGKRMLLKFEKLLITLKDKGEFIRSQEFCNIT